MSSTTKNNNIWDPCSVLHPLHTWVPEKFLMSSAQTFLLALIFGLLKTPQEGVGVVGWHETKNTWYASVSAPVPCSHSHLPLTSYLLPPTPEIIQPESVYPQALALDCAYSLSHRRHISGPRSKARQAVCQALGLLQGPRQTGAWAHRALLDLMTKLMRWAGAQVRNQAGPGWENQVLWTIKEQGDWNLVLAIIFYLKL